MTKFQTAEWWAQEFRRMLEEQRPEDLHLDYKDKRSLLPASRGNGGINNQKRAEDLSKDVSSFLNSDGGVLVYGVPESDSIDDTGGTPIPGGSDIGFNRGDIDKETIENLITSTIHPRPGPDLFQVSEVPYDDGKLVFLVEVAIGLGDVWQAKDKRYYKRFQYKAEPMEHYEINMVRERHQGPDLKLVFGINDRWESSLSNLEYLSSHGAEAVVHVGICNAADNIAESVLIEIGLWPDTNVEAMNKMWTGQFPDGVFPESFQPVGLRHVSWDDRKSEVVVAWSQLYWNGSNPKLGGSFAPVFRTEAPIDVGKIPMVGVPLSHHARRTFAFLFWRLQSPGSRPRKGVVELRAGNQGSFPTTPFLVCEDRDWEMV